MGKYYSPTGGLPPQTHLTTERAIVTEAYTVIPKGVMTDIVTSATCRAFRTPARGSSRAPSPASPPRSPS
jgi:glyoxylate utilization-related uncharacterized protein